MKFRDIIKEDQERPLDNNFYRRVLNIIAQKFDLEEISQRLNSPNADARWNATHSISRYAIMKDEETNYRDGIYLYLINTFELSKEEAKLIIFLLHKNIDVKDFLNDPLDTSLDFYVYSIFIMRMRLLIGKMMRGLIVKGVEDLVGNMKNVVNVMLRECVNLRSKGEKRICVMIVKEVEKYLMIVLIVGVIVK